MSIYFLYENVFWKTWGIITKGNLTLRFSCQKEQYRISKIYTHELYLQVHFYYIYASYQLVHSSHFTEKYIYNGVSHLSWDLFENVWPSAKTFSHMTPAFTCRAFIGSHKKCRIMVAKEPPSKRTWLVSRDASASSAKNNLTQPLPFIAGPHPGQRIPATQNRRGPHDRASQSNQHIWPGLLKSWRARA